MKSFTCFLQSVSLSKIAEFILVILFSLVFSGSTVSAAETTKVLFIGNSFTNSYFSLPAMFTKIATLKGKSVTVDSLIVYGQSLQGFWTDSNQAALNKIKGTVWNYVSLQPWGDAQDMQDYGILFVDEIVKTNPQAKALMYMVHHNLEGINLSNLNSQQTIYQNVAASRPAAFLVPVLWAWWQGFQEKPNETNWFAEDNWHPGTWQIYISAISMYSAIFRESPVGLPYNTGTGTGGIQLTAADAAYLQNLALQSINQHAIGFNLSPTASPTLTPSPTSLPSPTTPMVKPGDANGDGLVNKADLIIWIGNYAKLLSGTNNADFNNNGKVNILDFGIWYGNFGK